MGLASRGVRVEDGRPGHSLGEDPGAAIIFRVPAGYHTHRATRWGDYAHSDNLSNGIVRYQQRGAKPPHISFSSFSGS